MHTFSKFGASEKDTWYPTCHCTTFISSAVIRRIVPILCANPAIMMSYPDGIKVARFLPSYPSQYQTLRDLGAILLVLHAKTFVLAITRKTF